MFRGFFMAFYVFSSLKVINPSKFNLKFKRDNNWDWNNFYWKRNKAQTRERTKNIRYKYTSWILIYYKCKFLTLLTNHILPFHIIF